jgi:hypothetical protein
MRKSKYTRTKYNPTFVTCPQPQGLVLHCTTEDGAADDVQFMLLRSWQNTYCWLLLDDHGAPQRHGQFYSPLPECIRRAKAAARRWLRYLADLEDARDRVADVQAYEEECLAHYH